MALSKWNVHGVVLKMTIHGHVSQSQILAYVLEYDPNKNFHHILPSEQISNKSAMFVLTKWGKKHYHKSHNQWWFNLKIGQLISHQTVQIIIIIVTLYSKIIIVDNISIAGL